MSLPPSTLLFCCRPAPRPVPRRVSDHSTRAARPSHGGRIPVFAGGATRLGAAVRRRGEQPWKERGRCADRVGQV